MTILAFVGVFILGMIAGYIYGFGAYYRPIKPREFWLKCGPYRWYRNWKIKKDWEVFEKEMEAKYADAENA